MGLEHGRDASDPVDASHRPALEPSACEGGGALDLHPPQLRSRRHPDRVQAGHGSGDPELHRQPHHHDRAGQPGLRQEPHHLREGHGRHRLRIAPGASARGQGQGRGDRRRDPADRLRRLCRLREGLHAREGLRAHRRRTRLPAGARRALCRSEAQGDVALDHGLQPACARRMGQSAPLQSAPVDGKDLRARQFAVLADGPAIRLRHRARGRHLRASSARRHGRHQSGAPQAHRGNLARPARHHSGEAGLSRRRTGPDAAATAS